MPLNDPHPVGSLRFEGGFSACIVLGPAPHFAAALLFNPSQHGFPTDDFHRRYAVAAQTFTTTTDPPQERWIPVAVHEDDLQPEPYDDTLWSAYNELRAACRKFAEDAAADRSPVGWYFRLLGFGGPK